MSDNKHLNRKLVPTPFGVAYVKEIGMTTLKLSGKNRLDAILYKSMGYRAISAKTEFISAFIWSANKRIVRVQGPFFGPT
jgi:hypothetical protein